MTGDQPKPASSLTAGHIKRSAARIIDVAPQAIDVALQPIVEHEPVSGGPPPADGASAPIDVASQSDVEAALRQQAREAVAASAGGGGLGDSIAAFFNWRRAGIFGLVYLGALAIFWSVLNH
jgi:hypothetical protein